jgi:hypothetical protein
MLVIFYILLLLAVVNVYFFLRKDVIEYDKGYNCALRKYSKHESLHPFEFPSNSYEHGFNDGYDFIRNNIKLLNISNSTCFIIYKIVHLHC